MDELKLEPLEPLDLQEPKNGKVVVSGMQRWNFRRLILPIGLLLGILLVIVTYLLVAPESGKLTAQVFRFDILHTPETAMAVVSISNKQDKQSIIVQVYPVIFGKEYSGLYARSIEGAIIEGTSFPLVLNPGEVRVLKINFPIQKKDLDLYADKLKDSSHIITFRDGPPPGQLQGFLGLGWRVVDADGKNYTNTARIASYILTPTPPEFADPTALTHSWIISDDPFELCTQEGIVKE